MAQFGSALGSGLRGRRFESCRPDHIHFVCHPEAWKNEMDYLESCPSGLRSMIGNHVCGELRTQGSNP